MVVASAARPGGRGRDRVSPRHANARAGRARDGSDHGSTRRGRPPWRSGESQTIVRGPGQEEGSRDAARSMARRTAGRREVRAEAVAALARLRVRGDSDPGARHRRQQRDLCAGRRDAASPASVPRPGSPRDDLGADRPFAERRGLAAEPHRLGPAQSNVRTDRRIRGWRRRHGHGGGRWHARKRCLASGSPQESSMRSASRRLSVARSFPPTTRAARMSSS